MSKTVIKFVAPLSKMLVQNGYDEEKLINACQSLANEVNGLELAAKRGPFSGGQQVKADGTLIVKPIKWKLNVPWEFEQSKEHSEKKGSAPLEFVKFNDQLGVLFAKCGQPFGDLTPDILPTFLRQWIDQKMKLEVKPANVAAVRGNGDVKNVPALVPA